MIPKLSILVFLLFLGSCQTQWERYDESLYTAVFEPGQGSYDRHISVLESFAASDSPPPGFCAELGYFLALAGRPAEADEWFNKEMSTWPESSAVVEALRQLVSEESGNQGISEEVDS